MKLVMLMKMILTKNDVSGDFIIIIDSPQLKNSISDIKELTWLMTEVHVNADVSI